MDRPLFDCSHLPRMLCCTHGGAAPVHGLSGRCPEDTTPYGAERFRAAERVGRPVYGLDVFVVARAGGLRLLYLTTPHPPPPSANNVLLVLCPLFPPACVRPPPASVWPCLFGRACRNCRCLFCSCLFCSVLFCSVLSKLPIILSAMVVVISWLAGECFGTSDKQQCSCVFFALGGGREGGREGAAAASIARRLAPILYHSPVYVTLGDRLLFIATRSVVSDLGYLCPLRWLACQTRFPASYVYLDATLRWPSNS